MILPEDCYRKSEIPTALKIGYARFYKLSANSLPEPDGIYVGLPPAQKKLPYWHINTLKEWLAENCKIVIEKPVKQQNKSDKTPWAIPEHDINQTKECLMFRSFYNLMRTGL